MTIVKEKTIVEKEKQKIKYNKGNIPINQRLLNKYSNVKEIFEDELNNRTRPIIIKNNISELKNIDLKQINITELKKLANNIFNKHHQRNAFINNTSKITISKTGINESIEKIYNNRLQ